MKIVETLFSLQDKDYKVFQQRLLPTVDPDTVIGVRVPQLRSLAKELQSDHYYVNMMIAWYFATALAKQWDSTLPYIQERRLPSWVHKKTIQKACESFRLSSDQKTTLRTLTG